MSLFIESHNCKIPICAHNLSHKQYEMDLAFEAILNEFSKGTNNETNLKTVFCTNYHLHMSNDKVLPMVDVITEYVHSFAKQAYLSEHDTLELDPYNVWGALYDVGDYAVVHHHFPAAISTVLYLSIENRETAAPIIVEGKEYKPYTGMLMIFPGIAHHHVPKTDSKRVVMSINYTLKADITFYKEDEAD